ncbi:TIGR00730 family Rossman fold protein [Vaginisenegalia massiliensis]|uniref:LOG family protein n=1 Tax=Vaginisenegalia massiliensis TaxID=2058294 RepID=UPI000F52A9B1|nr:TIGR00730 family Rossman fold protein [Vaginisenegalia massiliensis]
MKFAVYCGAATGNRPIYQEEVAKLGQWLGENGHDIVYGGGKIGLMGVIADQVLANGGQVIGVMPDFLIAREISHQGLDQLIEVKSMAERKQIMLDQSQVCLALPGGPGTLEEIVEAISWTRIGQNPNPCVFYNIDGYYDGLKQVYLQMVEHGFLSQTDYERIGFASTPDELMSFVREYQAADNR